MKREISDSDPQISESHTCEITLGKGEQILINGPELTYDELYESNRRLRLLYDLGRNIYEKMDPEQVLHEILSAVKDTLDVDTCIVATLEGQQLRPRAAHNPLSLDKMSEWPVSNTVIKRVLSQGISVLSENAPEDLGHTTSIDELKIKSVMCVPMIHKSIVYGLIYLDNRRQVGAFTRIDLEFLIALSHYASLAFSNALEFERVKEISDERCKRLQEELYSEFNIVIQSSELLKRYGQLMKLAQSKLPIMLLGETGTGKNLLAYAIHQNSTRRDKPFMVVNIASLGEALVESELFGHEKGSFTSSVKQHLGKFELANGGTIFLDEVGEILPNIQIKLLGFMDEQKFTRVGGEKELKADVRIISATNLDIEAVVAEGSFRRDLYERLGGKIASFIIPPLRERLEDIPRLVEHFLKAHNSEKRFDLSAIRKMQTAEWPGNIRELSLFVERLNVLCPDKIITEEHINSLENFCAGSSNDIFLIQITCLWTKTLLE